MHSVGSAAITVLTIGTIYWFALEARWAKPSTRNGYTQYGVSTGLKLLFVIAVPLMLYGAAANLLRPDSEKWVSLLLVSLALFCLYLTPTTILCSSNQIVAIRWYGIKRVAIDWCNVVSVYKNPEDNSIIVRDKSNRVIVHSAYHVGRADFLDFISQLPYGFARLL